MGDSQPQIRTAVIALPAEIDLVTARQAGSELVAALVPGVTAVIADMTDTTCCDSCGINMLAQVHAQALWQRAKLILVVPSAAVLRVLAGSGLDTLLPIFPTLAEALSAVYLPEAGAAR